DRTRAERHGPHAPRVAPEAGSERGSSSSSSGIRRVPRPGTAAERSGGREEARARERQAPPGSRVPKKCGGVLREGVAMSDRYAAISAHRGLFPVRLMCRLLEVSTSGFYDAMARRASGTRSARMTSDEQVRVHVRAA